MCIDLARTALTDGRVLDLHFEDHSQCLEVHAVGRDRYGQPTVLGWLVADSSVPKRRDAWALVRLDRVLQASVSPVVSGAPRPGYRRGDAALAKVDLELPGFTGDPLVRA